MSSPRSHIAHKSRRSPQSGGFAGFAAPTSNTTYTPNQFFDVCVPNYSRGVVRLVGYMIRKTLGWCDSEGNPQQEQIQISYKELIEKAGIGHSMIRQTLDEAIAGKFIECVREGQPAKSGRPGCTALYQLRWDSRPDYRKKVGDFAGFFEDEGNRTDIPNQFFDDIIPNKPISVIKVVAAVIRFSIGFQARHGRRRQQATLSYKDIERYVKFGSPVDLAKALRIALEHNYLVRLNEGVFSRLASERRAAVYALRWADGWGTPKNIAASELSEKHSSTSPKNIAGEQAEKHSNIQMKPVNETNKQQAAAQGEKAKSLLKGAGFDAKTAAILAEGVPMSRIENQIAWIEKRGATTNRLGMLRKAIKENWPEPATLGAAPLRGMPGYVFARHFYAGFAGNTGIPVAEPSARDAEAAEPFAGRLLTIDSEPSRMVAWGRAFGELARQQNKSFPSFQVALRQLGDRFFMRVQSETAAEKRERQERARADHVKQYAPAYERFLREKERQMQSNHPADYARFTASRAGQRTDIANNPMWRGDSKWLELFDRESNRVAGFQSFFSLPTFWQWDATINPKPFQATQNQASLAIVSRNDFNAASTENSH